MKKKQKIFISTGILLIVIASIVIFLNRYLQNEIEVGLENEYPTSVLSYDDISVNAFAGNATIKNLRIKEGIFSLEAREVNLKDFSYSDYLKNENITIGSIHLVDPLIVFNKSDSTSSRNDIQEETAGREIRVNHFSSTGGNIRVVENDTAANSLYAALQYLTMEDIIIQKMDEASLLPFSYETVNMISDSLYFELSETHLMQAGKIKLQNTSLSIDQFHIIPKFTKEIFDQRIPYEQDWIALKVEALNFTGVNWKKEKDQVVFLIPTTSIENANIEIYRNKLIKDDIRVKPMYSAMLRELDFKLHMDSVEISNSYIEYQEKVLESRPPGKLSFHKVQASINNISNLDLSSPDFPVTRVNARALFMGETNLVLNWDFDVSNKMDEFHVKGQLGALQAQNINSFLVPAMNVEAEGNIQSIYFDFYGNRNQAKGKMQMAYRDFKVNILKDGEQERRSLLSRLANLIIKNDSMNEDVHQENIHTTRDKTKSFWNFLWLCLRDGALSTFF